ncbi:MAG: acyl transferase [Bacteroidota bacterium]
MKAAERNIENEFVSNGRSFEQEALALFRIQAKECGVYRKFLEIRRIKPDMICHIEEIPFLPVGFFKDFRVQCGESDPEVVFTSSGTTGMQQSKHYVQSAGIYERSFLGAYRMFYGEPSSWRILALLPSYLQRKGSSLIYMTEKLIDLSGHKESGFYRYDYDRLAVTLGKLEREGKRTLLLGVSHALLEFAEKFPVKLQHTIIMETGGMKGHGKELTREELHGILKKAFETDEIHSEYGMTELLSQAYSAGNGIFRTPPWMKIMVRDMYDPFSYVSFGKTGGINVIDLANRHSCAFVETADLGRLHPGGYFEVLGRFDQSELRGCNLPL